MSPLATIYAFVAALYLLECFLIARSDAIVFAQRSWNGEWRVLHGLALEGLRSRLYFGPLLPFRWVVSPRWPEMAGDTSFDLREARARFHAFEIRSRTLGFLCSAVTVHVLVFSPIIISSFGWRTSWIALAVILAALATAIVVDTRDIVRGVAGPSVATFAVIGASLLSPLAASRALTAVSQLCFRPFHPLVLYRLACTDDACHAFASYLLALSHKEDLELEPEETLFLRTEFKPDQG